MADNKPGDGANPPFGNGKGATSSAGASSGAHNFLEDPASNAPKTGGRDFTKESRPQEVGKPEDRYNSDTVPEGGDLPFDQTDDTAEGEHAMQVGQIVDKPKNKPFKLSGGG